VCGLVGVWVCGCVGKCVGVWVCGCVGGCVWCLCEWVGGWVGEFLSLVRGSLGEEGCVYSTFSLVLYVCLQA